MTDILGYTTVNNKWETITDKEAAKHDLMMYIYSHKGDCDWDPDFGTTIQDKIFQLKTETVKNDIITEIKQAVAHHPLLQLVSLATTEMTDGWVFNLMVSYLGGTPEEWKVDITEESVSTYISTGTYPLETSEE